MTQPLSLEICKSQLLVEILGLLLKLVKAWIHTYFGQTTKWAPCLGVNDRKCSSGMKGREKWDKKKRKMLKELQLGSAVSWLSLHQHRYLVLTVIHKPNVALHAGKVQEGSLPLFKGESPGRVPFALAWGPQTLELSEWSVPCWWPGLHLFHCNCQFYGNLEQKQNYKQKKMLEYLRSIYCFCLELYQR